MMIKIIINILCLVVIFSAASAKAGETLYKIKEINTNSPYLVWLLEDHSLPIINVRITFRQAGSAYDPDGKEGLAYIISQMLDEGAGKFGENQFKKQLEDSSTDIGSSVEKDYFYVSLKTLSDKKEKAFDLLSFALTSPKFGQKSLDKIKSQVIISISKRNEDPDDLAYYEWERRFFAGHSYGKSREGTFESLKNITREDLLKFSKNRFVKDKMLISIVGDINEQEVKILLQSVFSSLPEGNSKKKDDIVEFVNFPQRETLVQINKNLPQSVAVFGFNGARYGEKEFFPLYVLNYILGGGNFESRLMKEVREKRGLAYSTYSQFDPNRQAGVIKGYVGTRPDQIKESLSIIEDVLRELAKNGITSDELVAAKSYLTGSFAMQLDSGYKLASFMAMMQSENLGIDYLEKRNNYINAVTIDEINMVAKKFLNPDNSLTVVVGQEIKKNAVQTKD